MSNRTWEYCPYNLEILGNIIIGAKNSTCRLTISPGNILKFSAGTKLQIADYQCPYYCDTYGGELHAIGNVDSVITFTSVNDSTGGWDGIFFHDKSDYNGTTSLLRNCIIEKASQFNLYCENTNQPASVDSCLVRNSGYYGIYLKSTPIQIINSQINNNITGIYSEASEIAVSNNQFMNNTDYGLYFNNASYLDKPGQLGFSGNGVNGIAIAGGNLINDVKWTYYGYDYMLLGNLFVAKLNDKCRLTLAPGVTLRFIQGSKLQVGNYLCPYYCDTYGGEITAIGTADSLITFTSMNDSIGGWEGVHFHDKSDMYSAQSLLKHCIIEKANLYNLYCESTTQPTIDSCTIQYSNGYGVFCTTSQNHLNNSLIENNVSTGIYSNSAQISVSNLTISNNGGYGIFFSDVNKVHELGSMSFSGNNLDGVILAGGILSADKSWTNTGSYYVLLSNLMILAQNISPKLTIEKGCTLKFSPGTGIQVGDYQCPYYCHTYGGQIQANGTPDSLITFTALNDSVGGWNGIYFHDKSDEFQGTSYFKNCIIEKADQYNIYCNSTNQPWLIDNCKIQYSNQYGLFLYSAGLSLFRSQVTNNKSFGIYLEGNSNPIIGNYDTTSCDIFFNGDYDIYNNTTNNINARYNFWNTPDSLMIASRIFDVYDNPSYGEVLFSPFLLNGINNLETNYIIQGIAHYSNSTSEPMQNRLVFAKNLAGNVMNTIQTDNLGAFNFSNISNGVYVLEADQNDWGGVNSTDALRILHHFAYINTLDGIHLTAADVNGSNTVNATDAFLVMKRAINLIDTFSVGNWTFETDSLPVIVYGDSIFTDLWGLCYGDVNASYDPNQGLKTQTQSVSLIHEGVQQINSFESISIDIKAKSNFNAGAISLTIFYPEEYLDVTDVKLAPTQESLLFSTTNGKLQISWASLDAYYYSIDNPFINIEFVTKDLSTLNGFIDLSVGSSSEIADSYAVPHENISLSVKRLGNLITEIEDYPDSQHELLLNFSLNSYLLVLEYNLPESGQVSLHVYDLIGRQVGATDKRQQMAGTHSMSYNLTGLHQGIYLVEIKVNGISSVYSDVRKILLAP